MTTNIAYYARAKTRFRGALPLRLPSLSTSEAAERLGKGLWIIASQLAVILLNGTDVIVIAAMLGPASVVPYTLTGKLLSVFANVPQHMMASSQPALSELKASRERTRLAPICFALTQAVLLVSGLFAGIVIAVDRGFVGWWVGANEFAGGKVVLLLTLSMILSQWTIATTYTIFSFGYERRISITTVLSGLITFGATIACTHYLGIAGAPIASILGLVAVALPANLVVIARETGSKLGALFLPVLPWAWRFMLFASSLAAAARLWAPSSVVTLAATSIAVTLAYALLMLPLVFREPLGTYTRPRMEALRARLVGARR
jgi:O-antigen/teichoic acid export membrane protein